MREQLLSLERVVSHLLLQARNVGKTFIITNASEGWVQHSSTMCMPSLAPLLEQARRHDLTPGRPCLGAIPCASQVCIISARAGFEGQFPGDSHAWKMHAFLQARRTALHHHRSSGGGSAVGGAGAE